MENTISTGKAAKLLGVSVKTLQRWEREKRLIAIARVNNSIMPRKPSGSD